MVITRFAPSPTGSMHLGNFRAALFSYAWARKNEGKFILRIEDTDRERIVSGAEEELIETLEIFGILPDEFMRQSDNKFFHRIMSHYLIMKGVAYPCFCDKDSDLVCSCKEDKKDTLLEDSTYCVKLDTSKMPETIVCFDALRDREIKIDRNTLYDIVLLKSDGYPTYHLAAIVDDIKSGVTHVFRGDEWLSSFPYHVFLYDAFKAEIPKYYHLPLITNSEGKKLSKRDGDFSVQSLLDEYYIPSTIVNYTALLGWSPIDNTQEIFDIHELISMFDLDRLNKSPTKFDIKKLRYLNTVHLKKSYGRVEFKNLLSDDFKCIIDSCYEIVSTGGCLKSLLESFREGYCEQDERFLRYMKVIREYLDDKLNHTILTVYDANELMELLLEEFSIKQLHQNLRVILTGKRQGYPFDILIRLIKTKDLHNKLSYKE